VRRVWIDSSSSTRRMVEAFGIEAVAWPGERPARLL
jgi:hypothetical protein